MLDSKDRMILAELMKDSRKSTKAIAQQLGLPRATVHDRIRKMELRDAIMRYTAVPDYPQLDLGVTAFVLAQFDPEKGLSQRETCERIAKIPGVFEVHMISGEWDILLKLRCSSVEEVGTLVIERLREVKGVARTLTCASFGTIKE